MHRLRHRWVGFLALIVLTPAILFGSYGFYLAESNDMLPWQADPTRIAITPFADIEGFTTPIAFPTRTPAPDDSSTTATETPAAE